MWKNFGLKNSMFLIGFMYSLGLFQILNLGFEDWRRLLRKTSHTVSSGFFQFWPQRQSLSLRQWERTLSGLCQSTDTDLRWLYWNGPGKKWFDISLMKWPVSNWIWKEFLEIGLSLSNRFEPWKLATKSVESNLTCL